MHLFLLKRVADGAAQARTAERRRDTQERKQVKHSRSQTLPVLLCVLGLYVATVAFKMFK